LDAARLVVGPAIGVDEGSSRESPALAMIESVVDRVLAEFETDLALFEEMAQRVAAFIEQQKSAEGAIVERSARLIEERERDEIAREIAEQEIGRRLESRAGVPPAVREMLNETWVRALVRVHRSEGEGSSAWQGMLLGMEDLLWSVEPKVTADDRKRLITMLPGMLKTLHEGLVRGELDAKGRGAFLGVLVDCHAMAVKAGMRGLAVVAEPAPIVVSQDPSIERAMIPAGGVQVEEIRLRRGAAVRNVFTRTGVWTNLQRGTWVEFAKEGARVTVPNSDVRSAAGTRRRNDLGAVIVVQVDRENANAAPEFRIVGVKAPEQAAKCVINVDLRQPAGACCNCVFRMRNCERLDIISVAAVIGDAESAAKGTHDFAFRTIRKSANDRIGSVIGNDDEVVAEPDCADFRQDADGPREVNGTVDVDLTLFLPQEKSSEAVRLRQQIGCEFVAARAISSLREHGFCRTTLDSRRVDVFIESNAFYDALALFNVFRDFWWTGHKQ
jgi:hypothetical protein